MNAQVVAASEPAGAYFSHVSYHVRGIFIVFSYNGMQEIFFRNYISLNHLINYALCVLQNILNYLNVLLFIIYLL